MTRRIHALSPSHYSPPYEPNTPIPWTNEPQPSWMVADEFHMGEPLAKDHKSYEPDARSTIGARSGSGGGGRGGGEREKGSCRGEIIGGGPGRVGS